MTMGEQELNQLLMQKQDRVLALTLELREKNGLLRKQAQLEAMESELTSRYGDLVQRMGQHESRVAECFRQAFTELQSLLAEQEQGLLQRLEGQLELVSRRVEQLETVLAACQEALLEAAPAMDGLMEGLADGPQVVRPSP